MSQGTSLVLGDVRDDIEEELDYGDSMAKWVRNACKLRLQLENEDDPELLEDEYTD